MCKRLSLKFQQNLLVIITALGRDEPFRWNSLYCIWKESWFPSVIGGSDRPISGRALQTKSFFHKWHSHRRFRPLTVPGALKQERCFRKEACCSERSSGLLWQERKMWVNAKRTDFPYRLSYSECVCVCALSPHCTVIQLLHSYMLDMTLWVPQ